MQDIGDQQFLMLLLVVETDLDDGNKLAKLGDGGILDQALNAVRSLPPDAQDDIARMPERQRMAGSWP